MITPYKEFLKRNKLKQVELANYLNITESAISNLVNGKSNLSEENLIKLISNDKGWDVSMLGSRIENPAEEIKSENYSGDVLDKVLSQLSRAQEQLLKSQEQIDKLISIIEKMQEK